MKRPLALSLAVLSLASTVQPREFAQAVQSVVRLEDPGARLVLGDVDGDGDDDLCCASDAGIDIHLQDETGAFSARPDASFPWPAEDLAWSA